ncbi:MAG: hypothetical protein ABIF09_08400, partial [Gemmatimonadota bacterium]
MTPPRVPSPLLGVPLTSLLTLTLLLLPALSVGGCRGEMEAGDPGLVLDWAISPTPPAVGPARLIISLEDSAGAP